MVSNEIPQRLSTRYTQKCRALRQDTEWTSTELWGSGNLYIFVINQNIINNKIGSRLPLGSVWGEICRLFVVVRGPNIRKPKTQYRNPNTEERFLSASARV